MISNMKPALFLLTCSIYLCFCYSSTEHRKVLSNIRGQEKDTIDFKTQVQPVLQNNCSPCHFPGGKLYEKLPFDEGGTIISHKTGILKRFKKEEDLKLLRQYIVQNK